jgi:geranylgeranyl reductase family protein
MNNNFDVIISGCGPAGSILGYLLAENNISVLILEKAIFPRKKICAGGIQHRALKLIPFDVSPVIEKTIYGIYFSLANKDIIHKKNEDPIIYTVERAIFDNFLAGKAGSSGCLIQYGDGLADYEVLDDYVAVQTGKSSYKAKILVGADGVRGAAHKKITGNNKFHKIIGYETEIEYGTGDFTLKDRTGNFFDFKDSVRLDFNGVKKGYGWIFPKNAGLSCGVGAPAANAPKTKKYFKLFLSEFCTQDIKILAHGIPVRKSNTPYCGNRVLAVGDAACFGDGFTGEGLYNAIKSSIIAAQCIKNALQKSDFTFSDYFKLIETDICRDIKISLMLTKVFYSSVFLFYNLLKKNDNYFHACCRILRGERSYKEIVEKLKFIKF